MERLVSIIVPVFNVEKYIETCVKSILQQTYTKFELILIDDGSTDCSGDICNHLGEEDNRIKVIHQSNKGVSAARNVGIEVSRGEYICFIDSDDCVDNNFLEGFCFDFDISLQGYSMQMGNRRSYIKYSELSGYNSQDVSKIFCLNNIHGGPYSKLCKANILKNNNIVFPEGISLGEDIIFFLQYIRYCHFIYVSSACGYIYNKREGSLTDIYHPIDELMKKEKKLFQLYDLLFANGQFKQRFFHELSLFVVSKYYFCENIKTIQSLYLKDICKKYLSSCEKILLRMSYPLFCFYALWRRRFKRRVLRILFHHYDTTLLNI